MSTTNALSEAQVSQFLQHGVLVVPQVLSQEEVQAALKGFADSLLLAGCDVSKLGLLETQTQIEIETETKTQAEIQTEKEIETHTETETDSQAQREGDRVVGVVDVGKRGDNKKCEKGVVADPVSLHALRNLSSTNGAGGILDIFYADFKLRLNEHEAVWQIVSTLWEATIGQQQKEEGDEKEKERQKHFQHPFGNVDSSRGFMYIDRVCFRLPDSCSSKTANSSGGNSNNNTKSVQRSLTPHLDCCPHDLYSGRKWKPIQCFIALTDSVEPNQGGFEACPGHHINFDAWAKNRAPSATLPKESNGVKSFNGVPCVGQFSPIRPKEDADVISKFQHIACRAGDLVLWDYRIPHANAAHNHTDIARQVVYLGFLPDVPLNQTYAQDQLQRYNKGMVPVDQWHKCTTLQPNHYNFSELGQKLMGMQAW